MYSTNSTFPGVSSRGGRGSKVPLPSSGSVPYGARVPVYRSAPGAPPVSGDSRSPPRTLHGTPVSGTAETVRDRTILGELQVGSRDDESVSRERAHGPPLSSSVLSRDRSPPRVRRCRRYVGDPFPTSRRSLGLHPVLLGPVRGNSHPEVRLRPSDSSGVSTDAGERTVCSRSGSRGETPVSHPFSDLLPPVFL